MRNARNILCTMAICLSLSAIASAQDRPLFKPGAAPAKATAVADTPAPDRAAVEKGSLASGGSRSFMGELLPTGLALGATLLAIVLARSAIKRFGGKLPGARRPQGVVEVLARYPIARGQQVVLLKVGRRVLVTHQGSQGMQTLSEFAAEGDVADILARCEASARAASPFSFDALLRQSDKSMDAATKSDDRPAPRRADPRDALPALMRDAEIETVDLTRPRKRGGR